MATTDKKLVNSGNFAVVGSNPVRHDAADKVPGGATFGADVRAPGAGRGAVLRSPHAHARIVRIYTSRAEKAPGVLAVITSDDATDMGPHVASPAEGVLSLAHYSANMLARGKVLYEGHPVAAVAAVDEPAAEAAVGMIEVEYEALPTVMTIRQAMEPDAPLLHDDVFTNADGLVDKEASNVAIHRHFEEGDLEVGFAEADIVVENEFETATVHQGYIEPQAATARWSESGTLEIWSSSQGAFGVRSELAALLKHPVSKIKVTPLEIGGGFGGKATVYLEFLSALLARKSGRAVKMTMMRSEVLRSTGPSPGSWSRAKVGITKEGKLTAAKVWAAYEAGGYPSIWSSGAAVGSLGAYSLDNLRVDIYEVVVNKPHSGAYRAPGGTQISFAVETTIDEALRQAGLDPLEFRRRNASAEGDLRVDGPPFAKLGTRECIEAMAESDHWKAPLGEPAGPALRRGRGLAGGLWRNGGGLSSAQGRLNPDGTVTLLEGSVDLSGTRTTVAMQMAETLGIPVSEVYPIVPDTDAVGLTGTSGGSRTAFATGWAAHEAAEDMLEQMCEGMARIWEVGDVACEEGKFTAEGEEVDFKEAAALLAARNILVTGRANVSPAGIGPTTTMHLADVEVDVETGKIEILRYTAVQDAGMAVHPEIVEGQIQGGTVQGIGWALNEEYWYDEDGRMRNDSLLDYRMPTAVDLPMIEAIIVEVPNPGHPYGVRGVGEMPIVPPPAAIANAVFDATGIRLRELPMSPARVVAALRSKEAV